VLLPEKVSCRGGLLNRLGTALSGNTGDQIAKVVDVDDTGIDDFTLTLKVDWC